MKEREDSLPALVLAHREELLEQAKEKIESINPGLVVAIEQGQRIAGHVDVVVASVPSLGRANSKRLARYPRDYFRVIITDESHHAPAETYQRIFEYFGGADILRLGVTATPQRGDSVRLTDTFEEVVYYKSIEDLIHEGYLCRLRGYRVESDTDISSVGTVAGDYNEGQLAKAIDTPERNKLIVAAYNELLPGRKTLAFASSVQHGRNLEAAFAEAGIAAGSIFGSSSSEDRKRTISRFVNSGTDSDIHVLVNCGVLTEGFDFPGIEGILLARPTKSALLYTQIVGRGTRLSPGKSHCTVVDICDITRSKKPYGLPSLLGLPPDFNLAGSDLSTAAERFWELESSAPNEAARVRSLDDIELVYKQIDIFRAPPPSAVVLEFSRFIWAETGPDNFWLGVTKSESLHISRDALGRYRCVLRRRTSEGAAEECLDTQPDLRGAFATCDHWVLQNRKEALSLLDSAAIWRTDGVTEKQAKWLKKFGVPLTEGMTKGEASLILDKLFKDNPKPDRPAWLERKIQSNKPRKGGWF